MNAVTAKIKSNRFSRWSRVLHTIRHLQPRQAWYFFLRRGIGARRVKPCDQDIDCRKVANHPVLQLAHADGNFSNYEFNFLNRPLSFPRDAMDWCPQAAQRLWRYNLHYFDFLRDAARPLQQKTALIDDWIANNPQGSEPAWEPYTASLRIVNWCLFFWSLPAREIREGWRRSLYDQARWLEMNLELHILANHYFENIKALIFAALFFDDECSDRWLKKFQLDLIDQLREQTLADGGHYERSPQYHCILLEDYLDLYALFSTNIALARADTLSALKSAIESALQFLSVIATPDDDIPLFNDSASGAASRLSAIFAKANALGFTEKIQSTALIELPASGLFGWKSARDYFLIDCGDIGPAYQPGHTHCDFLSYVLMIDGQWLIVDSGVCEYEPGAMRAYVRSTAAHNTVQVDDLEQSEIWGEFRVARRAKNLGANIRRSDNGIIFEGAYKGFDAIAGGAIHQRRARLHLLDNSTLRQLDIADTLTARGEHMARSRLHLHPSLRASIDDEIVSVFCKQRLIARIKSNRGGRWQLSESWHCPQFGIRQENQMLTLEKAFADSVELAYSVALDT